MAFELDPTAIEQALTNDTLQAEAQSYHEMIDRSNFGNDRREQLRYWQAGIDVASFGDPDDINRARNNLIDVRFLTHTSASLPQPNMIDLMEQHGMLAAESRGDYLDVAQAVAEGIPKQKGALLRPRFMIALAMNGDIDMSEQAITEIEDYEGPSFVKLGLYRRLHRSRKIDAANRIIELADEQDEPLDAVEELFYTIHKDKSADRPLIAKVESLMDDISWNELTVEPLLNNQRQYMLGLAQLARIGSDPARYTGQFAYYVPEMDESNMTSTRMKMKTIAEAADIYGGAEEDVTALSERNSVAKDFTGDCIVEIRARQGDIAGAIAHADRHLPPHESRFRLLKKVAAATGAAQIIDMALHERMYMPSGYLRDGAIEKLAQIALGQNDHKNAYRIHQYPSSEIKKIAILRHIARAKRGAPLLSTSSYETGY